MFWTLSMWFLYICFLWWILHILKTRLAFMCIATFLLYLLHYSSLTSSCNIFKLIEDAIVQEFSLQTNLQAVAVHIDPPFKATKCQMVIGYKRPQKTDQWSPSPMYFNGRLEVTFPFVRIKSFISHFTEQWRIHLL